MTDGAFNRVPLTFANLLRYKKGFPSALLGFAYNDYPLSGVELVHDSPRRLCKRSNELLILSLALAHLGQRHASVDDRIDGVAGKAEAPDFTVTLDDSSVVGVEVAQVTDKNAAAADNLIEKLSLQVNQYLRTKIESDSFPYSVSLQLSIRQQRGFNSKKLVEEIAELTLAACAANKPVGAMLFPDRDEHPLLRQYNCRGQITVRNRDTVLVTADPFANLPATPDLHVASLIEQKRRLTYRNVGSALWLALGVTDPAGQFSFNVDDFRGNVYDVTPFKRIIITNGLRAVYNGDY